MSIEERARKLYLSDEGNPFADINMEHYIKGAEDQHEIDTDRACMYFERYLVTLMESIKVKRDSYKEPIAIDVKKFREFLSL